MKEVFVMPVKWISREEAEEMFGPSTPPADVAEEIEKPKQQAKRRKQKRVAEYFSKNFSGVSTFHK